MSETYDPPDRRPTDAGRAAGYRACIRALPPEHRTDRQREALGDEDHHDEGEAR